MATNSSAKTYWKRYILGTCEHHIWGGSRQPTGSSSVVLVTSTSGIPDELFTGNESIEAAGGGVHSSTKSE